ncbi:hypothetical protein FIBSPDRAFT_149053 [Athelia psychrophila]|uniref:Uncharacterized protein n=1 Tax=Athelia psychrophila TaxID=1759441 RepID=A0A166BQC9_9AGAM|nr:hypothetical protein FIBSPDRAFT_149053 [Fibularhizoctonia sp. CBS 109695]
MCHPSCQPRCASTGKRSLLPLRSYGHISEYPSIENRPTWAFECHVNSFIAQAAVHVNTPTAKVPCFCLCVRISLIAGRMYTYARRRSRHFFGSLAPAVIAPSPGDKLQALLGAGPRPHQPVQKCAMPSYLIPRWKIILSAFSIPWSQPAHCTLKPTRHSHFPFQECYDLLRRVRLAQAFESRFRQGLRCDRTHWTTRISYRSCLIFTIQTCAGSPCLGELISPALMEPSFIAGFI